MHRQQERIAYLDTAKGILILCLLYGHLRVLAKWEGLDDPVLSVWGAGIGSYRPFFMQTFFLITGFCSTFTVGFLPFLLKNLKTLILPAVLIDLLCFGIMSAAGSADQGFGAHLAGFSSWFSTGGPWFVIALFWAKILMWFISRMSRGYQFMSVAVLFLLGLALNHFNLVDNYQWHRHALMAIPFLFGGYLLKGNLDRLQRCLLPVGLAGFLLIVAQNFLAKYTSFTLPASDLFIDVTFLNFPLHFVNVAGGSALVLWLSQKLERSRTLSLLGQGSLLAYLMNSTVQVLVLRMLMPLYPEGRPVGCLCFHLAAFILCVAGICVLIWLIYRHKILSWIVGKF